MEFGLRFGPCHLQGLEQGVIHLARPGVLVEEFRGVLCLLRILSCNLHMFLTPHNWFKGWESYV